MERTARVRTAGATLPSVRNFLRARTAGRKLVIAVGVAVLRSRHDRRDDAGFVLGPGGGGDGHEHLLLLPGQVRIAKDLAGEVGLAVTLLKDSGPHVERLGRDA